MSLCRPPKFDSSACKCLILLARIVRICDYRVFSGRSWNVECREGVALLSCRPAGAVEGAIADVFPNAGEQIKRCSRARIVFPGLHPQVHDTMECEGQEADHLMRAYAVGAPMLY